VYSLTRSTGMWTVSVALGNEQLAAYREPYP
jgi:hypothetical protein